MGILNGIKHKYRTIKVESKNKQQLDILNNLFAEFEKTIDDTERIPPNKVVESGKMKTVFNDLKNVITSYENMIYKSLISSFCLTFRNTKELNFKLTTEEEWNQLTPLIEKYEKLSTDVPTLKTISKGEYEDFKSDLKEFSEKYPKWFSDGSMLDMQIGIENRFGLAQIERRFNEGKIRIERYLEKINCEREFLIETNFSILSPYEFEEYIANLFRSMGYKAHVTSPTKDMGVDIIAFKDGNKIAVQVKKYAEGNRVGNDAVQRLLGAMQQKDLKAEKGILITTSDFTEYAKLQAEETPVELWNGIFLKEIIKNQKLK